ncbi:hypothetical protein [Arthrobacter sp. KBS0703]|nr:hypothetical protein [Arthrobacter sp. KBS0703]
MADGEAVSYTHLDVYKRQLLGSGPGDGDGFGGPGFGAQGPFHPGA